MPDCPSVFAGGCAFASPMYSPVYPACGIHVGFPLEAMQKGGEVLYAQGAGGIRGILEIPSLFFEWAKLFSAEGIFRNATTKQRGTADAQDPSPTRRKRKRGLLPRF